MRLYEEIFKNADGGALSKCVIVPCGGGYFEGVKSVTDFTDDRVTLRFPHNTVEVDGENLCIKKYCDGDLQLSGRITALRVVLPQSGYVKTDGEKVGNIPRAGDER